LNLGSASLLERKGTRPSENNIVSRLEVSRTAKPTGAEAGGYHRGPRCTNSQLKIGGNASGPGAGESEEHPMGAIGPIIKGTPQNDFIPLIEQEHGANSGETALTLGVDRNGLLLFSKTQAANRSRPWGRPMLVLDCGGWKVGHQQGAAGGSCVPPRFVEPNTDRLDLLKSREGGPPNSYNNWGKAGSKSAASPDSTPGRGGV